MAVESNGPLCGLPARVSRAPSAGASPLNYGATTQADAETARVGRFHRRVQGDRSAETVKPRRAASVSLTVARRDW